MKQLIALSHRPQLKRASMKHLLGRAIIPSCGSLLIIFAALPAIAQETFPTLPNPEDTLPEPLPEDDTPELLPQELPELDFEEPPQPSPPPPDTTQGLRFRVNTIELLGITLDPAQLTAEFGGKTVSIADRIAALEGQEITLEELFSLRTFITNAYVNAGYITSGAFLPEQTFTNDIVVQIQIVEGDLEEIEINGLTQLQEQYVRDRIQLRVKQPVRQQNIEEALQLLQLDPLIETVDAQLLAGAGPGLSILALDITEAPSLTLGVSVNNYRSPSSGSEQINPFVSYANLIGIGDRLDFSYGLTEGLNSYDFGYTIPVTPQDGTLSFRAFTGNSRIVEDSFELLDIRSDSRTFSLSARQPLIKTPTQEFALGLSFDLRRSQTFIFGDEPFSFSEGADDGESKVSVIRFSQDWVDRTPDRVLAARSQFSLGIGAFDATISESSPDGRFLSWLGQFQWVQRLPNNKLIITRTAAQLTPDSLLSLEQFSLGGIGSVRGYQNNELVTDNGITASVELRVPLSAQPGELELTPFIEGGLGWDNENGALEELASVGVGLRWQIGADLGLSLDYGYPLIEDEGNGDTLHDNGFYFSLDWARHF